MASRFKRRHDAAPASPEKVLKKLEEQTDKFREALNLARDRAIEDTEIMSRATGLRTVMVHREMVATHQDVLATKHNTEQMRTNIETCAATVERVGTRVTEGVDRFGSKIRDDVSHLSADMGRLNVKIDEQYDELRALVVAGLGQLEKFSEKEKQKMAGRRQTMIATRERVIQQRQEINRTSLLEILLQKKQGEFYNRPVSRTTINHRPSTTEMEARIAILENQLLQAQPREGLLDFPALCDILAPAPFDGPRRVKHFDMVFKHPAKDLANAFATEGSPSCPPKDQSQVQSLLTTRQFTRWLNSDSHALLYVDAALQAADKPLSAASLFSAKLIAGTAAVFERTAIVLHFFCGLHCRPRDAWHGPVGMVRSLILQLLMRLVDMDPGRERWGLEFVWSEQIVQNLEEWYLPELCSAFHALLREVPEGMTVFVVLDSVLYLDRREMQRDWEFVLDGFLRSLVGDRELPVVMKVLMVNQAKGRPDLRSLPVFQAREGERWVELNGAWGSGEGMVGKMVEGQLRQATGQKVSARGRGRQEGE